MKRTCLTILPSQKDFLEKVKEEKGFTHTHTINQALRLLEAVCKGEVEIKNKEDTAVVIL